MRRSILSTAAAGLIIGITGAGAAGQGVEGTLYHSGVDDGTPAYFKAIEATAACTDTGPGVQAGQASFEAGKADYALPGLADGRYTLCLFVDTDDNIQQTGGPSSGDYGTMKPVTVEGETRLDVNQDEWMRMP